MDNVKSFEQLEEVVSKLLTKLDDLKDQNKNLENSLIEKNETIEELQGKVSSLSSDHENINDRVSTLLSSIEDWEKTEATDVESPLTQDSSVNDNNEIEGEGDTVSSSDSTLFSMGN